MLARRIITAFLLGSALVLVVLYLSTPVVAALLGLMFLAGAWEWTAFAKLPTAARSIYVLVLFAIMLGASGWLFRATSINVVLAVAAVGWVSAFIAVVLYPRRLPLTGVALAGAIVLLPAWASLVHLHATSPNGAGLTLTVLAIVWAADVGAYFTGRAVGRVKLAPSVSQGKTWEGVVGGVVLAAVVAALSGYVMALDVSTLVVIGIATALFSVLGDLTVSICKRNVGLKDSGSLLPGHGGVMDRIDSLSAAAPLFIIMLAAAGLNA